MQAVSSLKLVHYMQLRNLLGRDRGDSLMRGGIERLANRLNGVDMKSRQGSRQLLEGEIHALDEDVVAPTVLRGLDSPFQIIDDRQEFLEQLFIAESDLIALVPLSQALVVVKFSGESQILVVEFNGFFGLVRESPLKLLDQACFLRCGAIAGRWSIQVLDYIRVLVFLGHEKLLCP
jgi:hypothetical protein